MVGEASAEGKLELLQKARGHKKSVTATFEEMKKQAMMVVELSWPTAIMPSFSNNSQSW